MREGKNGKAYTLSRSYVIDKSAPLTPRESEAMGGGRKSLPGLRY